MRARDLSIYLLTTGVILRRRTAIKPRRAEFTVTGSNSFPSLSLSLPFLPLLSTLARTSLWRGSYEALWSESWDRGLAGSHDRWGFGLTPLVWSEPMVPPARGTALSLLLLLAAPRSAFSFSLCPTLSFFRLSTKISLLASDEKIYYILSRRSRICRSR